MKPYISIGVVDDHQLIRQAVTSMLTGKNRDSDENRYRVILEAENGDDLFQKLSKSSVLPNILLLDINMPKMDGMETLMLLQGRYPSIKTIMLTMLSKNEAVLQAIQAGAKCYLSKMDSIDKLYEAIDTVNEKGFYFDDRVNNILAAHAGSVIPGSEVVVLNDKEKRILKLLSTDKNNKEIAFDMGLSIRTIEGYRDMLYDKLNVKSRIGLVRFAMQMGLIQI